MRLQLAPCSLLFCLVAWWRCERVAEILSLLSTVGLRRRAAAVWAGLSGLVFRTTFERQTYCLKEDLCRSSNREAERERCSSTLSPSMQASARLRTAFPSLLGWIEVSSRSHKGLANMQESSWLIYRLTQCERLTECRRGHHGVTLSEGALRAYVMTPPPDVLPPCRSARSAPAGI